MTREPPFWARALLPVLGALSVAAAWRRGLPLSGAPAYVVPPPDRAIAVFETQGAMLWENFKPTAVEALAGFVAGNLAAILTAILFVHSRVMNAAYFPIALFFNTIPILALSPVIILIFGLGMTPKIIIAAIICYIPTLINMIRGLDAPTANERELFRILSSSRWEVFWRLRAPRSLPMLFASLRIASATAVIGHRRRMDRGGQGARRADHPGHVQLSVGPALRGDHSFLAAFAVPVRLRRRRGATGASLGGVNPMLRRAATGPQARAN